MIAVRRLSKGFLIAALLVSACTTSGSVETLPDDGESSVSLVDESSPEIPTQTSEADSADADDPLPEPTPFPVTEDGVRRAVERWFAAYNFRAENAFLAMLSDKELTYVDCDYEKSAPVILSSREEVRDWIRERWTRYDDRFFVEGVSTSRTGLDWEEGDPNPVVEVYVFRNNTQLSQGIETGLLIKITVPFVDGRSLLNVVGMEGRGDCMSGSFEGRYFPIDESDSDQ